MLDWQVTVSDVFGNFFMVDMAVLKVGSSRKLYYFVLKAVYYISILKTHIKRR